MSTSNTTSTVSSAPIVSSSVSVVSSSLTTQSSVSSVPIISSSSIAVSSSPPSSISTISSSSISTISSSTSSISTPSPSSSFSSSQPSISSSSKIPTPPSHHTASQTLSPSHISAEPSSLLQIATPIAIPPPIRPSLSLLTQLQEALDFTSTLLGLFFVSLLTLLLIYWSTLYILRKTVDINPRDTSPIAQSKAKNQTKLHPSNNLPSSPQKKEVGFAPHPSDPEFVLSGKTARETKRRLSSIPQSPTSPTSTSPPSRTPPPSSSSSSPYTLFPTQPWPTDGVQLAGLGSVPESKKDKIEQIAQATEVSELSEAAGRTKEDVVTEADLEFQRGVRDVSGDTNAIERRGGRSYGAL
ncbi:uncharacterized protein EAF01_003098 [Botrytis porri]|uniref:uncharacterized protein n=1 Tax=Botrytis porri TaxID=87229 RepID=UPI0018FFE773|nr:uncharacterized protein EAF01_003098 [Botrytis porri]KAF7909380.1 hypothetical protein EAF01_003098 [Botrytis porri]